MIIMTTVFSAPALFQQPAYAADTSCNDNSRVFLGFPTWYRGLVKDPTTCSLKSPADVGGISNYIGHIALNIIEIVSMLIGYVAIGMILYGGFQYLISSGSADMIKRAKSTITNAIIGLVLSLSAFGIVNLIVGIWK